MFANRAPFADAEIHKYALPYRSGVPFNVAQTFGYVAYSVREPPPRLRVLYLCVECRIITFSRVLQDFGSPGT
jgi:hypothetical protein